MTSRTGVQGARWCALASGAVWLACSTPDLGNTLFSCATDGDCAPGQLCAPFQGQLACQRAPLAAQSSCPGGSCDPGVGAGQLEVPPAIPVEVPASLGRACPDGRCSPLLLSPLARGTTVALPAVPPDDAGTAGALLDASPDARPEVGLAAPIPADDADPAVLDAGIRRDADAASEAPAMRYW